MKSPRKTVTKRSASAMIEEKGTFQSSAMSSGSKSRARGSRGGSSDAISGGCESHQHAQKLSPRASGASSKGKHLDVPLTSAGCKEKKGAGNYV